MRLFHNIFYVIFMLFNIQHLNNNIMGHNIDGCGGIVTERTVLKTWVSCDVPELSLCISMQSLVKSLINKLGL